MIDGDVGGALLGWTRMCRRARLAPGVGIFAGCGIITCGAAFTARDRRLMPLLEHGAPGRWRGRAREGVEAASFRPVPVSGASSKPNGPARTDAVPGGGPSFFLVRAACGEFNRSMGDKTIIKVDSTHSPHGALGQLYLATGVGVGMRLWRDLPPEPPKPEVVRDYETVGYVISGRAELHSEGQMVLLEPGNAWVVPRHARHTYKILEPFTAVEATHPPAEIHDRDRPVGQGNRSDSERDSGVAGLA